MRVILLSLFLVGCTAEGWEINNAVEFCKDHNGVDFYEVDTQKVVCNSGKYTVIKYEN